MATLRLRKTKKRLVWDVDFYYKGERHVHSTKTSNKKLARQILANIETKIAKGTFHLEEKEKPMKRITFSEFISAYIDHGKSSKRVTTLDLEKRLLSDFEKISGNRPMRDYDTESVDHWKAEYAVRVSPTTVNIALRSLRAAFNTAKRWGYVEKNPFDGIAFLKVQEKRLFLTEAEINRLFTVIENDVVAGESNIYLTKPQRAARKRNKLYFELLLNTGLRRAEAINIRPEDVDFEKNAIYIVNKTKTYRSRVVPMNQRVKEILEQTMPDLFSKIHNGTVTQKFAEYLQRAGLTGFKLHSLRHTFATNLIDRGVDLYTVSKILGHTDLKTTEVYAKVNLSTLHDAVRKLKDSNR